MLPAVALILAFGIPPDDAFPAFDSPKAVARAVRSLGYDYVPEGEQGVEGRLTRDGVAAKTWIASANVSTGGTLKTTLFWLTLRLEIGVSREIGRAEMAAWKAAHPSENGPTFEAHLGRTATETLSLSLTKTADRGDWRGAIEGFFRKGVLFGEAHGGEFRVAPEFDAAKTPLDDALRLDRADQTSLMRAADGWGWKEQPPIAYSARGWFVRYNVAGHDLGFALHVDEEKPDERKLDAIRFSRQGSSGDEVWENRRKEGSSLPIVLMGDKWYATASHITLDLTNGLPLAEIRRRVEAFAKAE